MANKTLQALVNGGLVMDISADPDTLAIVKSNLGVETALLSADNLMFFDASDADNPKYVTFLAAMNNLDDGFTISTSGGAVSVTFDNGNAALAVDTGELTAIINYGLSVGATNADCFIDNTGRIAPNTSSREVKENITDAQDDDANKLLALRPRKYNRIGQTEEEVGLVAEEVAETWPEIVSWKTVEVEPEVLPSGRKKRRFEVTDQPMGVNYSRLVAPLVLLAQSQAAEIEVLRHHMAEVLERLEALEAR